MTKREKALEAFKERFPIDDPLAWSAWKMAWDLAYNQAIDDCFELLDENPEYDIHAVEKLKV